MFIRAYLRASTKEQDASRAREALVQFAAQHDHRVASFYIENISGATLKRPELMRLIADSDPGDVILVEQVDRLARLKQEDWEILKYKLADKRIAVVSPELPTSWLALDKKERADFTSSILMAVNSMMLDMLAAVARKDYEDRRRRQCQGIRKAKEAGKYRGRQPDLTRRKQIASLLSSGYSYSEIQDILGCSRHLIALVSKEKKQDSL